MTTTPQLLSPVGDETCLRAAIDAGADAVFFGLGEMNMRVKSKGIDVSELKRIVDEAHQKKVQIYITLNVIVYEHELDKIDELLSEIKKAKVDAVICWDFAIIEKCRKLGITFHISTQASISNSRAALFYANLGAKAVVLARECTLDQIKEIKSKVGNLKIEVFCHGAMCVSVSGRCFMSQFLNCKSANRGECVQPCRREYKVTDKQTGDELEISNGYVMSPKDMCTLGILDQIVESGVDILKIEGRGRSPEYVYTVTKAYRRMLDEITLQEKTTEVRRLLAEKLINDVKRVYNRGFSMGFFLGRPGNEAWAKTAGSQAQEKKEFLGKITNYFKKTKIAELTLNTGKVATSDIIQIQGSTTGLVRLTISKIKKHPNNPARNAKHSVAGGQITLPCPDTVRKGDEVYKILNSC